MARLVVLTSPGLADGFRLAGAPTVAIGDDDAAAGLRGIIAVPDVGIVLVTADLWAALEERTRDGLERLARPLVLQLPVGELSEAVGRRAAIEEMLERASATAPSGGRHRARRRSMSPAATARIVAASAPVVRAEGPATVASTWSSVVRRACSRGDRPELGIATIQV